MTQQFKVRISVLLIFLAALGAAFFDSQYRIRGNDSVPGFLKREFVLGLDLKGGARLLYAADVSGTPGREDEAMESLRNAIERRVNLFGVSEPVVQVERSGDERRLAVELAGVSAQEAIRIIGATPFLEFRELNGPMPTTPEDFSKVSFVATGLDGKLLERAEVNFDPTTGRPLIAVQFNDDGTRLFAEITRRNIKKPVGIFLDGALLSSPIVQEEITSGNAQITGDFDVKEANELVRNLNAGALPVPVSLISQQTIEATLGNRYLQESLRAGIYGILAVAVFMIAWYRFPGFLAVLALSVYVAFSLAIFKLIPVTLTTAGIAGFILSIGMAVDANILVFERMKEELRRGRRMREAIIEGFQRAWTSIRDSNASSLITCAILYWLGTSMVKGFALTLAIGILVSMFTALTVTRGLLLAMLMPWLERKINLFMSGFSRLKHK